MKNISFSLTSQRVIQRHSLYVESGVNNSINEPGRRILLCLPITLTSILAGQFQVSAIVIFG